MDLSGLIFVVLAVAWAGYLIPRALRRHDDVAANQPFDGYSGSVRVLDRTSATARALLAAPAPAVPERPKRTSTLVRPTTRGAAIRRRRVLLVLVVLTAGTAGVAGLGHLAWAWVAAPGTAVVAWLVMCVLMARRSRRARPAAARPAYEVVEDEESAAVQPSTVPVLVESDDDELWDPVPIVLPTYVGKPVARRTVRTIELTRTGVQSAGHSAADTALARRAEADAQAARAAAAAEPTGPIRKVATA